jgi:hypothetical protein
MAFKQVELYNFLREMMGISIAKSKSKIIKKNQAKAVPIPLLRSRVLLFLAEKSQNIPRISLLCVL